MANLCDINDIELYLLTQFDQDPSVSLEDSERVEYLITAVSAEIEGICNRAFNTATYTELLDGTGTNNVFVAQYPIKSTTSVKYGDPRGTRTAITDFINYTDTGEYNFTFVIPEAAQILEIVYVAGFDTIPYDLNLIAVKAVVSELSNADATQNIKSEKLGDYSYTLSSSAEKMSSLIKSLHNYIKSDI